MQKKSDKTKLLLENTLVKLMLEKDFDKITVKDLTDKLNINRGTFYLHYNDKYDLLEKMEYSIIEELTKTRDKLLEYLDPTSILPSNKEILLDMFKEIYTYIKDNADFMKIILGPNGDLNFQMKLKNFIEDSVFENIAFHADTEQIQVKYLASIASSAQIGIIQKWLKSGMKESPEELAYFVSDVISNIYNGTITKVAPPHCSLPSVKIKL